MIPDLRKVLTAGPARGDNSWIDCALTHGARGQAYSGAQLRTPRLPSELVMAQADGTYSKLLPPLAKLEVLVFAFGLTKLRTYVTRQSMVPSYSGNRKTLLNNFRIIR